MPSSRHDVCGVATYATELLSSRRVQFDGAYHDALANESLEFRVKHFAFDALDIDRVSVVLPFSNISDRFVICSDFREQMRATPEYAYISSAHVVSLW